MLRKLTASALALALCATAAFADDDVQIKQIIVITEFGYFPMITYLDEGDYVRFYNDSGLTKTISAVTETVDEEPQWTTGALENGHSFTMRVGSSTEMFYEESFQSIVKGSFSFDEAPDDEEGAEAAAAAAAALTTE